MFSYVKNELNGLIRHIIAGTLLIFYRHKAFNHFNSSLDAIVVILLFNFFFSIGITYFLNLPNPEFNRFAIPGYALETLGLLATAIIIGKLKKDASVILPIIVQISSTAPFFISLWAVFIWLLPTVNVQINYFFVLIWFFFTLFYILLYHFDRKFLKTVIPFMSYLLLAIAPSLLITSGNFWYEQPTDDKDTIKYLSINQEELFDAQFDHLNTIKQKLAPHRPNRQDLYFLGFGSYATEDVFMKEIIYIQNLMDNRFDTKGRSVGLINNLSTMQSNAIASKSNLKRVLKIFGETMNKQEDILFLYLTSHGSKEFGLSVSFWPLKLNAVTPDDLKSALDNADIKWRIILVSACYSGIFIEPLKNENTLIMTASAHDKTSFGCGTKSDFTYFGDAVFREQLGNIQTIIPAFKNAIKSIDEREQEEGLTPSQPQIFIGSEIENKIYGFERDLNLRN